MHCERLQKLYDFVLNMPYPPCWEDCADWRTFYIGEAINAHIFDPEPFVLRQIGNTAHYDVCYVSKGTHYYGYDAISRFFAISLWETTYLCYLCVHGQAILNPFELRDEFLQRLKFLIAEGKRCVNGTNTPDITS